MNIHNSSSSRGCHTTFTAAPTSTCLWSIWVDAHAHAVVGLQRTVGERVETDSRDALHLAELVRLDEIVTVAIPSESQEAARVLMRGREDARRDLMSARHRLGKPHLRRGITCPGTTAWTAAHHAWLRRRRLELPGLRVALAQGTAPPRDGEGAGGAAAALPDALDGAAD